MFNSNPTMRRARRRGVSAYLFVICLPVILGITGFVVDMGNLYTKRAVAQRAADAAALAGAQAYGTQPSPSANDAAARADAIDYARRNGYDTANGAKVQVFPRDGGFDGRVRVVLAKPETLYFIPALNALLNSPAGYSSNVGASATAEKITSVALDLGGNYGTTDGPSNPSAFGPYAPHDFGDPYSTKFYLDGTPNDGSAPGDLGGGYNPNGFDYTLNVTQDYISKHQFVQVQLFDPETYSPNGDSFDEIRAPGKNNPESSPSGKQATRTVYELYKVNSSDGSLDKIASQEYWDDKSTDSVERKKAGLSPWISPDGFNIDTSVRGAGQYKLRVKTIDGSSENGYNLRAGPPEGANLSDADWNNQYGDKAGTDPKNTAAPITADNKLQMNYTKTGPAKVRLGYVPAEAAGTDLTIKMFDTDINALSLNYTTDADPAFLATGNLLPLSQRNDRWQVNTVKVPANFKGGYFYANYLAGGGDTSSWSMSYPGAGDGSVKLIQ